MNGARLWQILGGTTAERVVAVVGVVATLLAIAGGREWIDVSRNVTLAFFGVGMACVFWWNDMRGRRKRDERLDA